MLNAEFLKAVADLARDGLTTRVVQVPGHPDMAWLNTGGELQPVTLPPKHRDHVVYSVVEIARYAEELDASAEAVLWHSPPPAPVVTTAGAVVLVLDDTTRRDRVRLDLVLSRPFAALWNENQSPTTFDQRHFIRFLRLELGLPSEDIAPWRRLDWQLGDATRRHLGHGDERMGKELTANVSGSAGLPEELTVATTVYETGGARFPATVACYIDVDPAQQKIRVIPKPDQIRLAIDAVHGQIADKLAADSSGVDVFYGYPYDARDGSASPPACPSPADV